MQSDACFGTHSSCNVTRTCGLREDGGIQPCSVLRVSEAVQSFTVISVPGAFVGAVTKPTRCIDERSRLQKADNIGLYCGHLRGHFNMFSAAAHSLEEKMVPALYCMDNINTTERTFTGCLQS